MEKSPNEILIPVYVGDEIIYVTPPEFYAKFGGVILMAMEVEIGRDTLSN